MSCNEGFVMLYDVMRAQWLRAFLSIAGGTMSLTLPPTNRPACPNVPLRDIIAVYSSAGEIHEGHHLHSVVFGVQTPRTLVILRTAEPKRRGRWIEFLRGACNKSSTKFMEVCDMKPLRQHFSPQLYCQLFRGVKEPTVDQSNRHSKLPEIPLTVATVRRASLSACMPQRMVGAAATRRGVLEAPTLVCSPPPRKIADEPLQPEVAAPPVPEEDAPTEVKADLEVLCPTMDQPQTESIPVPAAIDKENIGCCPTSPQKCSVVVESAASPSPPKRRVLSQLHAATESHRQTGSNGDHDDAAFKELQREINVLTRRNVELQLDNVNAAAHILDLEAKVSKSIGEATAAMRRCRALEAQLNVQQEEYEQKLSMEKAEMMSYIRMDVERQLAALGDKWALREADHKMRIASLELQINNSKTALS